MSNVAIQPVAPTAVASPSATKSPKPAQASVNASNAFAAQEPKQTNAPTQATQAATVAREAAKDAEKAKESAKPATEQRPQLRLSIGYNEEAQRFVYKGLDPKGKTVSQYPTEDALKRIAVLRQAITSTLTGAGAQGAVVNQTL